MNKWMYFCGDDKVTSFIHSVNTLRECFEKISFGEDAVADRKLIEALVFLLFHCGDFEAQKNIVDALVELDKHDFKDWFADAWFSHPQTQLLFSQLHAGPSQPKDVRKFLTSFNRNECDTPCVLSLSCVTAAWNSYSLSPPKNEGIMWLDFNPGSKTLTLCVKELPSLYAEHVSLPKCTRSVCIELQRNFLNDIVLHSVKLISTNKDLKELEIKTTSGSLSLLVDITENKLEWTEVFQMWALITKGKLDGVQRKTPFSTIEDFKNYRNSIQHSLSESCRRLNSVLQNLGLLAPEYLLPLKEQWEDSSCFQNFTKNQMPKCENFQLELTNTCPTVVPSLKADVSCTLNAISEVGMVATFPQITAAHHLEMKPTETSESLCTAAVSSRNKIREQVEHNSIFTTVSVLCDERAQSTIGDEYFSSTCIEALQEDKDVNSSEQGNSTVNSSQLNETTNLHIGTAFTEDLVDPSADLSVKAQHKKFVSTCNYLQSCDLPSDDVNNKIEREDREIAAVALLLLGCP